MGNYAQNLHDFPSYFLDSKKYKKGENMRLFVKSIFLLLFFIGLSYLYLDFLEEDYFQIKNREVTDGLVLLYG